VAIVERQDDGTSLIRATGIGNCILTCEANEGGSSAKVNVNVESTFKKRENAHTMLSLTAVLTIACVFCAALSVPVVILPLSVATVVCGVLAIIKNKADRFWSFILMAVAVLIAMENMGITNIF
jgi:ABC-type multidrug transport system permease subunit